MNFPRLNPVYVGIRSFGPHPKSLSPEERDFESGPPSPQGEQGGFFY